MSEFNGPYTRWHDPATCTSTSARIPHDCFSSSEVQAALREAAMRDPRVKELVEEARNYYAMRGAGNWPENVDSRLRLLEALRPFERDEEVKP